MNGFRINDLKRAIKSLFLTNEIWHTDSAPDKLITLGLLLSLNNRIADFFIAIAFVKVCELGCKTLNISGFDIW